MIARFGGASLIDLEEAKHAEAGGKAAPLGQLLRAGLPVPPGFVVPTGAFEQSLSAVDVAGAARQSAGHVRSLIEHAGLAPEVADEIPAALDRITASCGDGYVAVRSSADTEDGPEASGAGQHDSFLAVRGPGQVVSAVVKCWASLWSERAVAYRRQHPSDHASTLPLTAVLVQRLVEADVAGVMFTGKTTRIEASWGLGESVVAGRITPDTWMVTDDVIVHHAIGHKQHRIDRIGTQVVTRPVSAADIDRWCVSDQDIIDLDQIGRRIEQLLGRPQDVEWAIADGHIWILQARPITAELPATTLVSSNPTPSRRLLSGTPASPGFATGPVRVISGPDDFTRVQPGDILVCRTTDPAWTALFGVVAAVVTEIGGLLSHAAIIAREHGLPAVLGVSDATTTLHNGTIIEVDGHGGHILLPPPAV
jgi:pyruvate,water dikinase